MIKQINEIPKCVETEKALIGCLLNNAEETISQVNNRISDKDFWDKTNQSIFKTAVFLQQNNNLDNISLAERLKLKVSLIAELQNHPSSITELDKYVKRIKNYSNLRKLISAGAKIQEMGQGEDLDKAINESNKLLAEIQYKENDRVKNMNEMLIDAMQRYEDRLKNKGIIGIASGFIDLDKIIHGFKDGSLNIIAARPSVGKTSLVLDIARNAAKKKNLVMVFSLEQSYEEITDKLICAEGNINLWKMQGGKYENDFEQRYSDSLGRLGDYKIVVDDNAAITPNHIRMSIKQQMIKEKPNLVVVDYLQIMSSGLKTGNRVEEITWISQQLKSIAKEFKIPVIALSQLSRGIEQRGDPTPKLSDLRDSGSIEQDADIVMFLTREKEILKGEACYDAKLLLLKHRAGPVGFVELLFDPKSTSFKNKLKDNF